MFCLLKPGLPTCLFSTWSLPFLCWIFPHKLPWLRICSAWLPYWQIFVFLKPSLCRPGNFLQHPKFILPKKRGQKQKMREKKGCWNTFDLVEKSMLQLLMAEISFAPQKDPPQKVWTSRSPHRWTDSNWSPGRRATSARSFAPGWTAKTKPSWQSCRTCREDTVCPWFLQNVDLSRSYCTPLRFSKVQNDEVW